MIKDAEIAKTKWKRKILKTIRYSYGKSKYFHESWEDLESCLMANEKSLLSLNIKTLKLITEMLTNQELSFSLSSSYKITPQNPTDRLIKLCKSVGATHYLFGEGNGINYHDPEKFYDNNIKVIQQSFNANHPVYAQQLAGFVFGLSILDTLFNIGRKNTRLLTKTAWTIIDNNEVIFTSGQYLKCAIKNNNIVEIFSKYYSSAWEHAHKLIENGKIVDTEKIEEII